MNNLKSLDYVDNYSDLLPSGSIRISPSMLYKFTDKKHEWYRNQVLGEETFSGNTSTVLGTCVHRVAELASKLGIDKALPYLQEEVPSYLSSFIANPEVDNAYVEAQYIPMSIALLNFFRVFGVPSRSEEKVALHIRDNIYLAGTFDALQGSTLIDYKTTSKTSPDMDIPNYYKWQLLAYAYALKEQGIKVDNIRIVWITNNIVGRISEKTGKPMKDYPTQVVPVTEIITEDDMRFIKDYITLIADTIKCGIDNPELVYMLFSDYRLKIS